MTNEQKTAAKKSTKLELTILTVVGARPNFMKAAPIIRAVEKHNGTGKTPSVHHVLVHTGQHYGELMSDQFFEDLKIPKPDIQLGVGSGTHAVQTANILTAFEKTLEQVRPDIVLVVGDVNSTVACALATSKLPANSNHRRPLVAHVEAGLRSFDREMPEEINRIVTDHLADLLFVTEKSGLTNLRREGISPQRAFFVGNTMIDSLLLTRNQANQSTILEQLGLCRASGNNGTRRSIAPYALLTLHRPSNVDQKESFERILDGLNKLSRKMPIIFPVHPRTHKNIAEFGLEKHFRSEPGVGQSGIILIDPLGYLDFQCLLKEAKMVLTDSGGIQEETTCLGVPCVTIRENTERPVTVVQGTNILAGTTSGRIRRAIARQSARKFHGRSPEKWDGRTAERILPILIREANKAHS